MQVTRTHCSSITLSKSCGCGRYSLIRCILPMTFKETRLCSVVRLGAGSDVGSELMPGHLQTVQLLKVRIPQTLHFRPLLWRCSHIGLWMQCARSRVFAQVGVMHTVSHACKTEPAQLRHHRKSTNMCTASR